MHAKNLAYSLLCVLHLNFRLQLVGALRAALSIATRIMLRKDLKKWKETVIYEVVLHVIMCHTHHLKLSFIMMVHSTCMLLYIFMCTRFTYNARFARFAMNAMSVMFIWHVLCLVVHNVQAFPFMSNAALRHSIFYMIYAEHVYETHFYE